MRYLPAVLVGRVVRSIARARKPGGGAAIPGVIVNKIAPKFLAHTLNSFEQGLVIVTGSAGKSTTTRVLAALIRAHGLRVFTNPSTANIAQGLTSAIIASSSPTGKMDADIAILEMDEAHAAKLSAQAPPRLSILLNVCIDQIDRFYDPRDVAAMLTKVSTHTTGNVIANRDDMACVRAARAGSAPVSTFGLSDSEFSKHGTQLGYVSPRSTSDDVVTANTVVESARGREASFRVGKTALSAQLPSVGLHYAIDVAAAVEAARVLLGDAFDIELTRRVLNNIEPVFGRGEIVSVNGEDVTFVLVQNPVSFQLNVATIPKNSDQVLVAIGSDVRDYSYLWGANIRGMAPITIATGPRAYDVALHALYSDVPLGAIEPDLIAALDEFFALPKPRHGMKTVVFSADSMRRTRAYLNLPEQEAASV